MTDLPFVTQPLKAKKRKVGSKATGILSVPIYGSLTVGEVIDVEAIVGDEEVSVVAMAKLAQQIEAEQNISVEEAFTIVERGAFNTRLEGEKERIRIQYVAQIAELTQLYIKMGRRRQVAHATALIRSRCDRPEWENSQTESLPQKLVEDLAALFREEASLSEEMPSGPPNEEQIKKSQPGTESQEDTAGNQSSGDSAEPSPANSLEKPIEGSW